MTGSTGWPTSDNFDVEIPFIDASLSEVVDLGAAFDLAVLSKIDFEQIHSLQDFVAAVTAAGLVSGAITYDAGTRTLAIPLDFDIELSGLSLRELDAVGRINLQLLVDEGLVQISDTIPLTMLLGETDVTMADLFGFALLDEGDLVGNLSTVLLADVFVQGSVDREDLLSSDLLERAALDAYVTQNAQGQDVVAVAALIDHSLATLADLVQSGLIRALDFNWSGATITETNLLASGLVPANKLADNHLVQGGSVQVSDLVALQLANLHDLVAAGFLDAADLSVSSLDLSALLASNVVAENLLVAHGLGTGPQVDLEGLLATGLVTEDELVAAGLADPDTFWDGSVVTLRELVSAGLVDQTDLTAGATVPLGELLESDVVGQKYLNDEDLAEGGYVSIEDLLADSHAGFIEMVNRGLLPAANFVNKVFEQSDLEAIIFEGDHLFEDGELDNIVHVGTVSIDTLLTSILYDVTLAQYAEEGFVGLHDFTNIFLTVSEINATFGVALGGSEIQLYSLVALDLDDVTLVDLIDEGFVDRWDLKDLNLPLDIRHLERSDLFETGDLNNYITAHQVYLYDLLAKVYIGDLVTLGRLGVNDLVVRNLGSLADLVEDGLLGKNDFQSKTFTVASLSGLVSATDLNLHHLVSRTGTVSMQALIDSEPGIAIGAYPRRARRRRRSGGERHGSPGAGCPELRHPG